MASAADLGGNCCADLEERVAELEATTARKGNRKVKLTVYGQVNEALMWWDDGQMSDVYQVTNDNARTRFGFRGDAKIADDWKAGFQLEIGIRTANSKRTHQDNDEGNDTTNDVGFDVRHAYWYIDSKKLGRISIGQTGGAAEGITEVNLAATKDIAKYSDVEDSGMGMAVRQKNGLYLNGLTTVLGPLPNRSQAFTWRRFVNDSGNQAGEGNRRNIVKYDTPEIAGFTGTVNWGEDDFWEMGLRYKGEHAGFKFAAGAAYGENGEERTSPSNPSTGVPNDSAVGFECLAQGNNVLANTGKRAECNQFGGSLSIMHEKTGLYFNVAGGILEDELVQRSTQWAAVASGVDSDSTFWAVEGGIEKKFFELGKTTMFLQYNENETGARSRTVTVNGGTARVLETELHAYGLGVIQELDKAAMHVYLTYRHYEADMLTKAGATGAAGALFRPDLEDLDVVMGGALIKF